jgi:hypothetical protein
MNPVEKSSHFHIWYKISKYNLPYLDNCTFDAYKSPVFLNYSLDDSASHRPLLRRSVVAHIDQRFIPQSIKPPQLNHLFLTQCFDLCYCAP